MVHFLSLALLAGLVSAIPTIEVKGSKFFTSDGDQFFVKGKYISSRQSIGSAATDNVQQALRTSSFPMTRL
jgi:hypothetical protein